MNPVPLNRRLIDLDVVYYGEQLHREQIMHNECAAEEKAYYRYRVEKCAALLSALVDYRAAIDAPPVPL